MKKIVNIMRRPVLVDTETFDIVALGEKTRGIDSVYVIPEDAKLHWEQRDADPIDVDVNKDDILITFYDSSLGKDFTVVKSEDWKEMLDRADAVNQAKKEEWAADKCCKNKCF